MACLVARVTTIQTDRFTRADPKELVTEGVTQLNSVDRTSAESIADAVVEQYGVSGLDPETAGIIKSLYSSVDAVETINCIKRHNLHEVDDYDSLIGEYVMDADFGASLEGVFELLDRELSRSLCNPSRPATKVTQKANRSNVHVAEVDNLAHDVYMAKTLSSPDKIKIAHDLHPDNRVIQVDQYEMWETLLGWKKLKDIPHGSKQIHEKFGDRLSDDVLTEVAGPKDTDTKTNTSTTSTRSTGPAKQRAINLGVSRSNQGRRRLQANEIAKRLDNDEPVELGYNQSVDMIVLFPPSSDRLLSEHWWVAGDRAGGVSVAIANCIQGTFEYLNQYDAVLSIDEYVERAYEHSIRSTSAADTLEQIDYSNLILHVASQEMKDLIIEKDLPLRVVQSLGQCSGLSDSRLPDQDEMVYATITRDEWFWLRPAIHEAISQGTTPPTVVTSNGEVHGPDQLSVQYVDAIEVYARARLHNWNNCTSFWSFISEAAHRSLQFDQRGRQVIDTFALSHDAGLTPPDRQNL